jgi:hypothetical protein
MKTYIDILMEAIEAGPPALLMKQTKKRKKRKVPTSEKPLSGLLDGSGTSK